MIINLTLQHLRERRRILHWATLVSSVMGNYLAKAINSVRHQMSRKGLWGQVLILERQMIGTDLETMRWLIAEGYVRTIRRQVTVQIRLLARTSPGALTTSQSRYYSI